MNKTKIFKFKRKRRKYYKKRNGGSKKDTGKMLKEKKKIVRKKKIVEGSGEKKVEGKKEEEEEEKGMKGWTANLVLQHAKRLRLWLKKPTLVVAISLHQKRNVSREGNEEGGSSGVEQKKMEEGVG